MFCKPLTCFILILFLFFKEPTQKSIKNKIKTNKKKKKSKKNYVYKFWYQSSVLILYHLINVKI